MNTNKKSLKDYWSKFVSYKALWFLMVVLAVIAIALVSFFQKRSKDKTAWPEPVAMGDCIGATPEGLDLITVEEASELVKSNKTQSPQLTDAYRYYLINGYSQEKVVPYATSRALELAETHEKLAAAFDEHEGFDASEMGSVAFIEMTNLLIEFQLLKNIQAIGRLETQPTPDYQKEAIKLWIQPISYIHKSTRGTGAFGRVIASEIASAFSSEVRMGTEKHPFTFDQVKEFNAEIRKYLKTPDSLEQAFRDDYKFFSSAAISMYEQMAGKPVDDVYGGKRIGGVTGIYVKLLGGSPEVTQKNLEGIFSRLIVNSRNPYSPGSILEGLPPWCHGVESGPYTVDPIAEAIVTAYLDQIRTVVAMECQYETELRVTMIGFAVNAYKHAKGTYPVSLNELIDEGLILKEDLVDPFSVNRSGELKYLLEEGGAGWRIYSVGVDQKDNNGVIPVLEVDPSKPSEIERTDLVYQSGERERRIKAEKKPE